MFTIDYVYGSHRLFETIEEAEKQIADSFYDHSGTVVISEVKKVVKVKRPAVELIEVDLETIKTKPCTDCPEVN